MENKKILNDEELEKVNGGVTSRTTTVYDFAKGELFFDGKVYYHVYTAQGNLEENNDVDVRRWHAGNYRGGSYTYKTVKELLSYQNLGIVSLDDALKL